MRSTSSRFKVSVLMKVMLHRHHPSAELRNQQSGIYHKLAVTPSCSYKESIQCRKQLPNWLQLRVYHHRGSRTLFWQYTIPLFRRLTSPPIESTEATMTVPGYGRPKKKGAETIIIIIDTCLQPTEFKSWKISFKSEVSHSSQYPRAAMLRIGEVEDATSIDDRMTAAPKTGRPIPDFENLDFKIAADSGKS